MKHETLTKIRKKIISFKFTMQRGYSWISFLMMGVVVAVSVTPYVQRVLPWVHMWMMAIAMMIILFTIGYFDNKYRFLHTEQDYSVERNPLLIKGLKGELK